jgi:hypothetical protein
MGLRMLMRFVEVATIAGLLAIDCAAQSPERGTSPPADPGPAANIDADTLRARAGSGDHGPASRPNANGERDLLLGLGYRNNARDATIPTDQQSDWSLRMNFNLNSPRAVELNPSSSLGLPRKPAPGFTLERKF